MPDAVSRSAYGTPPTILPMRYFIRISGLSIFVIQTNSAGHKFLDVLFLDAGDTLFKPAKIDAHEPQIDFGTRLPSQSLIGKATFFDVGADSISVSGDGTDPSGVPQQGNWDWFTWLPRLSNLASPGTILDHLIPKMAKFPLPVFPLPKELRGFLRISGSACGLSNGGFAGAGPLQSDLQLFSTAKGSTALAESALLTITSARPPEATVLDSSNGKFFATLTGFSEDIDDPDVLSNETTSFGSYLSDLHLYGMALKRDPGSRMIEEKGSAPWPAGIPAHLIGGRTASRPVCPPVIGEWP